ncbi:TilS substrate-binding domain-containing protein, partial [Rhodococcus chondri]
DGDALDAAADALLASARDDSGPAVDVLSSAAPALRRRAVRQWLLDEGVSAPPNRTLRAIDDLVAAWRGQGPVAVGGGPRPGVRLVVSRRRGRLNLDFVDQQRCADD